MTGSYYDPAVLADASARDADGITRAGLRRARAAIAREAIPHVRSALERLTRSTVIVTEYTAPSRVRWGWGRPPHAGLDARFAADREEYRQLIKAFEEHLEALRAIPRTSPKARDAHWQNDFFGGLDAVALYHFLQHRRPAHYLEVGSGFSTKFARRAIVDAGLATTITSIDPAPRAEIDALCDKVHRVGLQDVPGEAFDDLRTGDIVFIDGSHVVHMDSDVAVAFTEVLPRIPPGVLVGIDDIFLPWDYPEDWIDRWYGEQYLLAVLLLSGDPTWKVVLPTWWASNDPDLAELIARFENPARGPSGTIGKSFWLERCTT